MKKPAMMGVLLAAAIAVAGTTGTGLAKDINMTAYTGAVGGLYMETASVWVKLWEKGIPNLKITPVLGGGSTNPVNVEKAANPNEAIGITDTITTVDAWNGTGEFATRVPEGLKNLRALYRYNTVSYTAYAIRGSKLPAGVTTLGQLLAKKPALQWAFMIRGNPGELGNRRILLEYGVKLDDLKAWGGNYSFNPHAEIATLMTDGHAHIAGWNTRAPAGWVLDMDASIPDLVWLPIETDIVEKVDKKYGGYIKLEHPVGHYKTLKKPFLTLGVDHVIFVRKDMTEDLAYRLTKIALENPKVMQQAIAAMNTFDPKVACKDVGSFPLHPGAERACKEIGGR